MTAERFDMEKWTPTEAPYRVTWYGSGSRALNGWSAHSKTFPTLDAAVESANKMFGPGVTKATLDLAKNPEDWLKRGGWKSLGGRKRKQELRLNKFARALEVS